MIYHQITHIWIYLLAAAVLQSMPRIPGGTGKIRGGAVLILRLVIESVWLLSIVLIIFSPTMAEKISGRA